MEQLQYFNIEQGGHMGFKNTLFKVSRKYFWDSMAKRRAEIHQKLSQMPNKWTKKDEGVIASNTSRIKTISNVKYSMPAIMYRTPVLDVGTCLTSNAHTLPYFSPLTLQKVEIYPQKFWCSL
jgi:hypothetical protein